MSPLRTALLQNSGHPGDPAGNLKVLDEAAASAAADGAGLLVTAEMFLTGYAIGGGGVRELAEPADGPSGRAVAEIAATHGLAILYGYPESHEGAVYNSARLVGADGAELANYRKSHLYGCFERGSFTPGEVPVVQATLGELTVGILICYDVEFPENVRAHALAGTDLLLVPTAQMHPFEFVAESVIPVRAFESQMYIAYVNRSGVEGEFDFVGLSCLAGPDGATCLRAGRGEELLLGDVAPKLLSTSRRINPYLRDRRPRLYSSLG
ncbi:carbon-nitrogen hydrolase family protein [Streptomyces sp. NPDC059426]|uniref:carbon-nitrogen hydrolase family protein n=1 Tax=Streptomyces sp. NPDC059426 TaxID=3346827 RepID=UPI0036884F1C